MGSRDEPTESQGIKRYTGSPPHSESGSGKLTNHHLGGIARHHGQPHHRAACACVRRHHLVIIKIMAVNMVVVWCLGSRKKWYFLGISPKSGGGATGVPNCLCFLATIFVLVLQGLPFVMAVMTSWYERYLHDYILIQSKSQQTSID